MNSKIDRGFSDAGGGGLIPRRGVTQNSDDIGYVA